MNKQQYMKERYQRMRKNKSCVQCGNKDERTLSGKAICCECNEKSKVYRRTDAGRVAAQRSQRTKYAKRLENHQCVHCGKKLPDDYYYIQCSDCKEYQHRKYLECKKKKTAEDGNPQAVKMKYPNLSIVQK